MSEVARSVLIGNKRGLHARASAKFVTLASAQPCEVAVTKDGVGKDGAGEVAGTSIMGLMMLAASPGTSITVQASGNQAPEVMAALEALVARLRRRYAVLWSPGST